VFALKFASTHEAENPAEVFGISKNLILQLGLSVSYLNRIDEMADRLAQNQ